jgi:hypothetical protein
MPAGPFGKAGCVEEMFSAKIKESAGAFAQQPLYNGV